MKRIFLAYKDIINIIYNEAPIIVITTFVFMILNGLLTPLNIYINKNVFDGGLAVANNQLAFSEYSIYLVLFVIINILPFVMDGFIYTYVEPRSLLILRTTYKSRMLKKLKTMKYEHFENEASAEIIDKAYHRAENSVMHLWPMYVYWRGSALIASIGSLAYLYSIKWWLLLTVLVPYLIEAYIAAKTNYNIYTELETYWKKERKYSTLGGYLRSRNYTSELKAYGNFDYLIDTV